MARTLDVYLYRELAGHLTQDGHGDISFEYNQSWLDKSGVHALSQSLPLRAGLFTRRECRGFFSGILPEAKNRETIARNLGISARNDFAMLEEIGGECAGAVTFITAGKSLPAPDYQYRPLSEKSLATILRELPRRPLMAGEDGVRLSLAGAQDKIAVCVSGEGISIPLGGAPSTHILKPAVEHFKGVVFNEALCMTLAKAIGLPVAKVEIRQVEDIDFLLVKRYDRRESTNNSNLIRLHQEDFCQALGISSERKYQGEGGPSLKDCFNLIREISSAPVVDLQNLLNAVIFNYLVGNHDAHGKNFSLLYKAAKDNIELAPLYDIVCTAYYPEITKKMAMQLGGEYKSELVRLNHFENLAEETGLAKPLVKARVLQITENIMRKIDNLGMQHDVAKGVIKLVKKRCQNVG